MIGVALRFQRCIAFPQSRTAFDKTAISPCIKLHSVILVPKLYIFQMDAQQCALLVFARHFGRTLTEEDRSMPKRKTSNIIFIALVVVAVAEIAFAVFYVMRHSPAPGPAGKASTALVRTTSSASA